MADSNVFVVRNQLGHYWGKKKHWVDGTDPRRVLHSSHEDEAINTLFELSSRDIELRGEVLAVTTSDRGEPIVEPSDTLLPDEPDENIVNGAEAAAGETSAEEAPPSTANA